jgi:hypothetical protein
MSTASKASVEWPLVEHDPLILHTAKKPEPKIPKAVKAPDYAKRLPKASARSPRRACMTSGRRPT